MPKKKGAIQPVNIRKNAYAMETEDGNSAEITMYGDIYEQQPKNWYGDPIEGQFITLTEFLSDLERLSKCKEITIRMNSYGGDAGVSNTIHNRLRELARDGATLSCVVDGVAMSGGSLIMCACDHVRVNPSSLIMIHKCWTFLFGGYNADELREQSAQQDAVDRMQIEIYKRKTGLSETVLSHMMRDTTYMTGREAAEKGFADEVIEDAEPLDIAASADGRMLFVGGRQMHLAPGMFAPDTIPTVTPEAADPALINKTQPVQTGGQNGGKTMAKNLEELRSENPELAEALMAEARAAASAAEKVPAPQAIEDAVSAAVQAEQKRIQEIDELSVLYDAETVKAAKYGENACTAQEMAYRAAQKAAKKGKKFLDDLDEDLKASGVQGVQAAGDPGTPPHEENMTPNQRMDAARSKVKALFQKEEK